jgi:ribose-phosphate pyrophosphokinase
MLAAWGASVALPNSTTSFHADCMKNTKLISHRSQSSKDSLTSTDDGSFGHETTDDLCLVAGHGNLELAKEVADLIGIPLADMTFKSFSDGECLIRFDENVRGRDVFVFQSCAAPVNDTAMELLLTISCARRAGARKVIAVVPYFGYKHHRRSSQISTRHQSRFLSSGAVDFAKMIQEMGVDRVIAVDLQRPGQGQEACFFDTSIPLEVLISLDLLVKHFVDKHKNGEELQGPVVVVTPNAECFKKARKFQLEFQKGIGKEVKLAAYLGTGYKNREEDLASTSQLTSNLQLVGNDVNVEGADVIIVDDMIDTAGTLSTLTKHLQANGASNVYVAAAHGLFTESSMKLIDNTEALKEVVVTDSLPMKSNIIASHKVKRVGIAPMLAEIIQAEYFRWEKEADTHGMQDGTED